MQRREAGEKHLSYVDLSRELTGWKKQSEWDWLNNSPSHTLQQSLKQLEAAYKNFFEKRAAFPKFKKKGMGSGIRFPEIKNVRAKSGLNRSILDQGWGEFIRQLQYKMLWAGGELIEVPPQYTSQTCPCCGHTHKDNRKTQAKFACGQCGYENHADHVGAINVLARAHEKLAAGYAVSACGEPVQLGHSVKQEPTEEIAAALP